MRVMRYFLYSLGVVIVAVFLVISFHYGSSLSVIEHDGKTTAANKFPPVGVIQPQPLAKNGGFGTYQFKKTPRNVSEMIDRYTIKTILMAPDDAELNRVVKGMRDNPDYIIYGYLNALCDAVKGPNRWKTLEYNSLSSNEDNFKIVAGRCIWALEQLLDQKFGFVDGKTGDAGLAAIYSKVYDSVVKYHDKVSQKGRKTISLDDLKLYYGLSAPKGARLSVDRMERFLAEWSPIDGDIRTLEEILGPPSRENLWGLPGDAPEPDSYVYYVWSISGGAISYTYYFRVKDGIIVTVVIATSG